jgi:hypothetical protein
MMRERPWLEPWEWGAEGCASRPSTCAQVISRISQSREGGRSPRQRRRHPPRAPACQALTDAPREARWYTAALP